MGLVLAGTAGCDGSTVVRSGPHEATNNDTPDGGGDRIERGADDAGHGPDDHQVLIESGLMTGAWRVSDVDSQAVIATVDLFQEQSAAAVDGYYTMGEGIYSRLAGKSGDLADESTYQDGTLTLRWNPSDIPDEMYTITAQKDGPGAFSGHLSAIDYKQLDRQVKLTRQQADSTDPATNPNTTAGSIDAGPQGAAGLQGDAK